MHRTIRNSLVAATAAIAISATTAAAAVPTWFDGSDRDQDRRVTWNEFVRHHSNFDELDENGDRVISGADAFVLEGREESSWLYVEYLDANASGAVTKTEYDRYLRAAFAGYDRNGDGTISAREVDGARTVRAVEGRRLDGRGLAARRGARS